MKLTRIIFTFLGVCISLAVLGQSGAEKDLVKAGDKLFDARNMMEALPNFRQLLSISPTNRDYNFKYGACLLSSDEDVEEAIKHLKFSVKGGGGNPLAHYYLGRAYHLNYQFQDAIGAYDKFQAVADSKLKGEYDDAARLAEMAKNGKTLLSEIKDISVLDKSESSVNDFFRSYEMQDIGGKVITVPDELLSAVDKKKEHRPLIHFPADGVEILFSSYGSNGSNLDLYSAQRLPSGKFSKPEKLQGVNTEFDEDYPFMHSDGVTLYFSSKGHNSMGGYDVFRAVKDASTGGFGKPENLDFAISSPDDDIFYMVDADGKLANFASSRSSEDGRLHVYRVKVQASAMSLAIIKGDFQNEINSNKIASIKVVDANTNKEIATYNTNKSTGEYLIDLPKSGKYKFFVEAKDSELTHTGMVDIPFANGMKAYKQEMSLVEVGGLEKLVIKNLFDEEVNEDVLALAQRLIKQKAELDINSDGTEEEPLVESEEVDMVRAIQGAGFEEGTSLDDVLALVQSQVQTLDNGIASNVADGEKAMAYAELSTKKSEEIASKAAQSFSQVDGQSDAESKEELLVYTSSLKDQSNYFKEEADVALSLLDDIEQDKMNKQLRKEQLVERNERIGEVLKNGSQSEIIEELTKVKKEVDNESADVLDFVSERAIERKKEAERMLKFSDGLRTSEEELRNTLITRKTQLEKTKNKKQRKVLENDIVSLNSEIEDYQEQINRSFVKLSKIQKDSEFANRSVDMLEKVRVGAVDQEIASIPLRPVSNTITAQIDQRLRVVDTSIEAIAVSKKDIQDIFDRRPELRNVYVEEMTMAGVPRSAATGYIEREGSASTSADDLTSQESTGLSETEPVTSDSAITEENEVTTLSGTEGNAAQGVSGEEIDEDLAENSSVLDERIDSSAIDGAESPSNLEVQNTAADQMAEDRALEVDYQSLSLDDLLNELNENYQERKEDIIRADDDEEDRDQAMMQLNDEIIQKAEERITYLEKQRWNAEAEEMLTIDGNVTRLKNLIEGLNAENKQIRKEGIESIDYPEFTEEVLTEDLQVTGPDQATEELSSSTSTALNDTNSPTSDSTENSSTADTIAESVEGIQQGQSAGGDELLSGGDQVTGQSTSTKEQAYTPSAELSARMLDNPAVQVAVEEDLAIAENPEVNTSQQNLMSKANGVLVQELTEKSNQTLNDIDENSASETERLAERIEVNAKYKGVIESLADQKNAELATAISAEQTDAISSDLENLTEIIAIKEKQLAQDRLALRNETNGLITERDFDIAQFKPNYISKKIEANKVSKSESELEQRLDNLEQTTRESLLVLKTNQEVELNGGTPAIESSYVKPEDMQQLENLIESLDETSTGDVALNTADETIEESENRNEALENAENTSSSSPVLVEDERIPADFEIVPIDIEGAAEWEMDYSVVLEEEGLRKSKFRSLQANLAYPTLKSDVMQAEQVMSGNSAQDIEELEMKIGSKLEVTNRTEYEHYIQILSNKNVPSGSQELLDKSAALQVSAAQYMKGAEQYRMQSRGKSQEVKNGMLKKAVAMEVTAIDQLSEALVIYEHLEKGGTEESFVFTEAIIVDEVAVLNDIQTEFEVLPPSAAQDDMDTASNELEVNDISPNETETIDTPIEDVIVDQSVTDAPQPENEVLTDAGGDETIGINTTSPVAPSVETALVETENSDTPSIETTVAQTPSSETPDVASPSAETLENDTPEVEAPAEPVVIDISEINSVEDVNDLPVMTAAQIQSTYPEVAMNLSLEDVRPIEKVAINRTRASEAAIIEYVRQMDDPSTEQMDEETKKEVAASMIEWEDLMDEKSNYILTVVQYKEEREKRELALAQVINSNGDEEEKERLIAEIQVIDAYIKQGTGNVMTLDDEIAGVNQNLEQARDRAGAVQIPSETADAENLNSAEAAGADETNPVALGDATSLSEIYVIPAELDTDRFMMDASVETYSASNPIPVNVSLPDGLVYQVQVGAYRNPIPQDLFRGFAPIIGTRLQSGITRYTVGLFLDLNTASRAKGQIKQFGYEDAFIVAFMDGKRISLRDADQLAIDQRNNQNATTNPTAERTSDRSDEGASPAVETVSTPVSASSDSQESSAAVDTNLANTTPETESVSSPISSSSDAQEITETVESSATSSDETSNTAESNIVILPSTESSAPETTIEPSTENTSSTSSVLADIPSDEELSSYYTDVADAAPASQVEVMRGLFYTVQVGVYSKPVPAQRIFNISPLNSELLSNGLIKYTSGIFDDRTVAEQWKERVVSKGVADAYVTAYFNGERISLAKAERIVNEEGENVLIQIDELNDLQETQEGEAVWEMVSTSELFDENANTNIGFKIRMGPYYNRIPDDEVKVILDFEDRVEFSQTADGAFVYRTKGMMSYSEARTWKETYLEKGIRNANIVAFEGDREIPVKQALDILLK